VTLEPCSHYGKTGPCVDALLNAGIKRVVAAIRDPHPLVSGRGFQRLKRAGIAVQVGLLEKEARKLNADFILAVTRKRPKVLLKAAMSLDGKIAAVTGKSKWITGGLARKKAHELRASSDAILVGSRTVLRDNPSLSVRLPGFNRKDGWPLRVVLDSKLQVSPNAQIFKGPQKTIVFTSRQAPLKRQKALERKGAVVFRVPLRGKMLSLGTLLKVLGAVNVRTLLVEGGGEVHASFLKEGLADEAALFVSPKILGGQAPTWVGGKGVGDPNDAPFLKRATVEPVGNDFLIRGTLR
jgi:diaminohydroxyphosphoribosylaminopyrimidine deaminase/5-amino-6-(5-phosphoribosylamino)uracil reductase